MPEEKQIEMFEERSLRAQPRGVHTCSCGHSLVQEEYGSRFFICTHCGKRVNSYSWKHESDLIDKAVHTMRRCVQGQICSDALEALQKLRTAELNAKGDLVEALTGDWDETPSWRVVISKVKRMAEKLDKIDNDRLDRLRRLDELFVYAPHWPDVAYMNANGEWPDGVPKWAAERAKRWNCGPTSLAVLMCAAEHEINRLQKLVELTFELDDSMTKTNRLKNVLDLVVDSIGEIEKGMSSLSKSLSITLQLKAALDEAKDDQSKR